MKLSVDSARDLLPGGRIKDHVVKGLELRAGGEGKSWLYYYRGPDGRQRRPKLGAYPALGIDDARTVARTFAKQVALGADPSAERQKLRGESTVADLGELYMREHAARYKKPASIEQDARNLRLHILPKIGRMRVSEVRVLDINGVLDNCGGRVLPNRVRALLSTMFNLAEHSDYQLRPRHSNPVTDTRQLPERRRHRKVELVEFELLAAELDKLAPAYPRQVAVIRVSLLAGTRITELCEARKAELNGHVIEREEHKTQRTGESRIIRLPRQALDVIASLPVDYSPYIFGPGLTDDAPCLGRWNIYHVWRKALKSSPSLAGLRPQDLRRTFASIAGKVGVGLDDVGQLLGHLHPGTTRRYKRLYEDSAAANTQATADKIGELMRPALGVRGGAVDDPDQQDRGRLGDA